MFYFDIRYSILSDCLLSSEVESLVGELKHKLEDGHKALTDRESRAMACMVMTHPNPGLTLLIHDPNPKSDPMLTES